jgi:hypothetical protein
MGLARRVARDPERAELALIARGATTLMECEGAPRDLGRDQGEAVGPAIRAATAGSPLRSLTDRIGRFDPASQRWLRDVRRHFPHQGEWIEGLARAAGVPDLALARAMRAALTSDLDAVVFAVSVAGGVRLARTASPGAVLRRSRPEGRFESVELGDAILTSPWIGVNEGGLAVAVVAGAEGEGSCAASGALLARDCLERFDSVESALAWCLGRPVAPGGSIALADAAGGMVGVALEAKGRRFLRTEDGALVLAGRHDPASLQKSLTASSMDGEDLAAVLTRALGSEAASTVAVADPVRRSLRPAPDAPTIRACAD